MKWYCSILGLKSVSQCGGRGGSRRRLFHHRLQRHQECREKRAESLSFHRPIVITGLSSINTAVGLSCARLLIHIFSTFPHSSIRPIFHLFHPLLLCTCLCLSRSQHYSSSTGSVRELLKTGISNQTKPNLHQVPVGETKFTKMASEFWSACCQIRWRYIICPVCLTRNTCYPLYKRQLHFVKVDHLTLIVRASWRAGPCYAALPPCIND